MSRYLYWLPVVLYMGVIYYFSSKTGSQVSIPTPDYVAHAIEYFGLSWLVRWAWQGSRAGRPEQGRWVAIIFCFIYALSDEFHQSFVPGRTPSAGDLLADTAGAILAQVFWYLWKRA